MANKKSQSVNFEKIGIYIAAIMAFLTILNSVMDMKERIARIETRIEYLEKGK